MPENPTDGEIKEPDNSTVDDWFGQNVARDQDVADQAAAEAGEGEEGGELFEERAEGEERFRAGHQRPDDGDEAGGAVGKPD